MLSRLTLALTLLVTAPAAAAGPTSPIPLAPATPDGNNPACVAGDRQPGNGGADVAVNAAGDAVVSWTHDVGGGAQVVQAAVRPAGGSFGPPETIGGTLPCAAFGVAGHTPQAAIDGAGNVVVAFAATSGGNVVIRASQRPAGGRFGTPADLSDDSRRADGAPRIAMSEAGLAAVVWSRNNGAKDVVQVAVKPPRGSFAPAVDLSNALQNARGPRVAVNDAGAIAASWSRETAGTNSATRAQATVRPAGAAAFVTPQDLSGTGPAREAHVGLDGSGRVLVTWLRTVGQADVAEAGALTPQGVVTGGVDPVSEPGEDPNSIDVAVTPAGEALAAYVGCGPGPCVARSALRPQGGRFATPETVSPPVNFDARVQGAIGRGGAAAVAVDNNFAGGRLLVAHRPAGGAFADVAPLSAAGADAFGGALAVDGEGNAVAVWTAATGLTAPKAIQAAALDAAGPAITALDVPPAARADVPVRLAAAARDRWSGAALSWDLGDGAAATGAAVEHAFPPGTHTVALTAADGAGNVTRATRILRVAAAPVPPAPEVVTSTVFTRWAFKGKRFALLSMRVARPPARAGVELRCRGGKCPFRSRTVTRRKRDKGQLAVVKTLSAKRALDLRGRRFRAGQRVQVRITAPGAIGRVVTFKLKAGLEPRGKPSCLPPGSRTPEACPQ